MKNNWHEENTKNKKVREAEKKNLQQIEVFLYQENVIAGAQTVWSVMCNDR